MAVTGGRHGKIGVLNSLFILEGIFQTGKFLNVP